MTVNRAPFRPALSALFCAATLAACGGGSPGDAPASQSGDTLSTSAALTIDGTGSLDGKLGNEHRTGATQADGASETSEGSEGGDGSETGDGGLESPSELAAPDRAPVLPPVDNQDAAASGADDDTAAVVPPPQPIGELAGPAGATAGSFGALTFREEWNGSRLDTGKWGTRMFHWTTQELDNWRVEDGVLKLWTPRDPQGNFEFNNRAMNTAGKFSQRYGWFEMEAKLPKGRGLWPSFWLYAHNDHTRPEIDIMEAYGGGDEWWATADGRPIDYGATVWISPADGSSGEWIAHQRPGWRFPTGDLTAGFHTYGAKWEPDGITFYFDGRQIGDKIMTDRLNQQMYMIIGLGTGKPGTFNAPTAETPTTIANAFEINYVRAWALPQGTTTGGSHPDPRQ